ncbi:MAG: hypothetical protein Q9P14_19120, partial [candidate division KSB1 bacterium]|nr:hypothetical protein [candidate division KSB1 bacterium]
MFFSLETIDHFLRPFNLHFLQVLFGEHVYIYKGIVTFWAILVSIGIIGLALRRFVFVQYSPNPKSYESGVVALMILLLMVTYLYTQSEHDPTSTLAKANWWLHASLIMIFPHLILRSKHFHIIMAPVNIFFRTERLGELLPLNLDLEALESEDEVSLGLEKLEDLSWKNRLDFVTCVECRRCTDHCPANLAGQELDPRGFILQGRSGGFRMPESEPVIEQRHFPKPLAGPGTELRRLRRKASVRWASEHLQVLTDINLAQKAL